MNDQFDLKAFQGKRDTAQRKLLRWECSVFEVTNAYKEGERNFEGANLEGAKLYGANLYGANLKYANLYGANLYGANLEGANLYGATLYGANFLNTAGIYSVYSPNMSSRGAALLGGVVLHNNKIELRFWAGCKQAITAAKLLEYVKETHDDNIHAEQYRAAIKFIQATFKSDMKAGKWDYLIDWKSPIAEVQK